MKSKMLWIDEDLDDFPALSRMARREGFELIEAYSIREGVEALAHLAPSVPDVMLTDAIVPWGGADEGICGDLASLGVAEDLCRRFGEFVGDDSISFTGLRLVQHLPHLFHSVICLSVVPIGPPLLSEYGLPSDLGVFLKADLAHDMERFVALLTACSHRGVE